MKKLFMISLIFVISNVSFAHKEWVHKHIAIQAYEFLKLYYPPIVLTEFNNRIGDYPVERFGNPWQSGTITAGVCREDWEDVMYHASGIAGEEVTISHFWDADLGDNSQIELCNPGCENHDNAYQKALNYINGGHELWAFFNLCYPPDLAGQAGTMYLKYNSLVDLYKNKRLYIIKFVPMNGTTKYYTNPVQLNDNNFSGGLTVATLSRIMAWEILGRIAHLLADMSVPAHVKVDFHPCKINDPDGYELYMGGNSWNIMECEDVKTSFPAQNWTALTAQTQGELIDIAGMNINEVIRDLFYTQNQLADHFPSTDNPGDNDLPNGTNPYIQSRYQMLGSSPVNVNEQAIADETFNFCIRATATLFCWFATQTDMLPIVTVRTSFDGGTLIVNGETVSSGYKKLFTNNESAWFDVDDQDWTEPTGKTYHRVFKKWEKVNNDNELTTYDQRRWDVTLNEVATYTAVLNKQFNITVPAATFIESGSGGTYNITTPTGTHNSVSSWTGTIMQDQSMTIQAVPPSSEYIFSHWSDGTTANPLSLIPQDHVNLSAVYKKHLASTTNTATKPSTQTKIIAVGNTRYAVYTSGGSVYFIKDNGSGWTNEIRVNGEPPYSQRIAKNPSITYDQQFLRVVWEEIDTNGKHYIMHREYNTDGLPFGSAYVLSNEESHYSNEDATPVVAGGLSEPGNRHFTIAWRVNNEYFCGLMLYVQHIVPYNTQFYQFIPNGKLPSLSYLNGNYNIVYANESNVVYFRQYKVNNDGLLYDQTTPENISGSLTSCSNPNIAYHTDGRIFVAWDALNGSTRHIFMRERNSSGVWQTTQELTHGTHQMSSPSIGIDEGTAYINVVFECSDHLARKSRSLSSSTWNDLCNLCQGYGPSINSTIAPRMLWVSGTSQPYTISSANIAAAPSQPVPNYPPNYQQNVGLQIAVGWNCSFGASTYRVQVATDAGFSNIVFNQAGITSTSQQISGLNYDTWYYWHVNATNSNGTSEWSALWRFKTYPYSPPACPYVFSWNGERFVIDNNVLPQSDYTENKDKTVTDYYKLLASPKEEDGNYILELREFEQELTKLDEVKLIAIDHSLSTNIAVLPDGDIVEYVNAFNLQEDECRCNDNMEKLSMLEGNAHTTKKGDYFLLSFEPILDEYTSFENLEGGVLLGGWIVHEGRTIQTPPPIKKETVGSIGVGSKGVVGKTSSFTFRERSTLVYVPLDPPKADEPQINIFFNDKVAFDYASLVAKVKQPTYMVNELTLKNAFHSKVDNITHQLIIKDGMMEELYPGESIQLTFKSVPLEQGKTRSFVLITAGRYEHIDDAELLTRVPTKFELKQNYPNPFNPSTVIRYQLPEDGNVLLKVFNQLGQEVASLFDGQQEAGYYERTWDASASGGGMPSGIYYVRLYVSDQFGKHLYSDAKKVVVMK